MTWLAGAVLLVVLGAVFGRLALGGRRPRLVPVPGRSEELRPAWTAAVPDAAYEGKPLLSAWERRALLSLRQQIPPGHYLCPQVRLADMLRVTFTDEVRRHALFARIKSLSVDFAVVELTSGSVALVVELDDRTHDRPDRQRRDVFVNTVLGQAGIPIHRFRPDAAVQVDDFFEARRVAQATNRG